jgi:hypothetical protein
MVMSDRFHDPTTLPPLKSPWYPLNRRPGAPQSQFRKDKILLPLLQIEQFLGCPACSLVTIPTVRFAGFTAVYLRFSVFWDVMLHRWVGGSWCFIEICDHLQGFKAWTLNPWGWRWQVALKCQEPLTQQRSITYQKTRNFYSKPVTFIKRGINKITYLTN